MDMLYTCMIVFLVNLVLWIFPPFNFNDWKDAIFNKRNLIIDGILIPLFVFLFDLMMTLSGKGGYIFG